MKLYSHFTAILFFVFIEGLFGSALIAGSHEKVQDSFQCYIRCGITSSSRDEIFVRSMPSERTALEFLTHQCEYRGRNYTVQGELSCENYSIGFSEAWARCEAGSGDCRADIQCVGIQPNNAIVFVSSNQWLSDGYSPLASSFIEAEEKSRLHIESPLNKLKDYFCADPYYRTGVW